MDKIAWISCSRSALSIAFTYNIWKRIFNNRCFNTCLSKEIEGYINLAINAIPRHCRNNQGRTPYSNDVSNDKVMSHPTFRSVSHPGNSSPLLEQRHETVAAICITENYLHIAETHKTVSKIAWCFLLFQVFYGMGIKKEKLKRYINNDD